MQTSASRSSGSRLANPSITSSTTRRTIVMALLVSFGAAWAHVDDPKARDWEPPFVGPPWRLADQQAGTSGSSEDSNGVAGEFASSGVDLLSWFPATSFPGDNTSGNDCWGYVSPSGREYAIVGLSRGTGIVDITVPERSEFVTFLPGPQSLWRNVKTYKNYLYAVSEGGGGIQVFDLAQIDLGIVDTLPSITIGGVQSTHTMIINEETGYLYRMGGSSTGLRVYKLEPNPAQPQFVANWNSHYIHDGCVINVKTGPYAGREVFLACGGFNGGHVETRVSILDVTNKTSMNLLSAFYYPDASYCHQIWPSDDLRYAYINDETDESSYGIYAMGRIVDLTNLNAPTLAGTYDTGLRTVDHNLYTRGNLLYCSNYKSGLRIFDISDRTHPVQIAWFDTYPQSDEAGYAGLWSNYPFFPSGTVIGSDIQRGLFVWRVTATLKTGPDLNGDGIVDGDDLAVVLGHWGTSGPGDLNGDGIVDGDDIAIVLGAWG